jgi:hypothetical protein
VRRSYARLWCPTRPDETWMKPSTLAAGTLTLCVATLLPASSSGTLAQTTQKIVEYNERVAMSTGQIRKGDICADFYPDLESDEFFKGLQRIDNEYGSEFQKYSHPITTYPSRLTIQIDVRTSVCDADVYTPVPPPEFLKTLHFKVQWKRQLYLRPVAGFSVANVPLNLDDDQGRRLLVIQIRDANNIPLTDHLILTILSPEGKILSRMAARL